MKGWGYENPEGSFEIQKTRVEIQNSISISTLTNQTMKLKSCILEISYWCKHRTSVNDLTVPTNKCHIIS